MATPQGSLKVTAPRFGAATVTVVGSSGVVPIVYSNDTLTTTTTFPLTIAALATQQIYFQSPGTYTMSVLVNGEEGANPSTGTTVTFNISSGEVAAYNYASLDYSDGNNWLSSGLGGGTADDTARMNAALASGGIVRGIAGQSYKISSTLKIPAGTTLDMTGCTIKLLPGANCQMLANSDYTNGNANIRVTGGTWDYDYLNQTSGGNAAIAFDFRNTPGLMVDNCTVKNATKYAIRVANTAGFTVQNIILNTHSDGVHVNGPASNGVIRNISGVSGDDMIALTCRDYVAFESSFGDITDMEIENIFANGSLTALKLLGGGTTKMRRIHAKGIHGTTTTHPVVIINDGGVNGGVGTTDVGAVTIEYVTVAPSNTDPQVFLTCTAGRDITLRDIYYESGSNAAVQATLGSITHLTIENLRVYGTGATYGVQVNAGAVVGHLVVRGLTALDSAANFSAFNNNGGTVTTALFTDVDLALASSSYAFAVWGVMTELIVRGARISGPQTVFSMNGSSVAELKLIVSDMVTSSITNDHIDTGRPVVASLDGCQWAQSGGTLLAWATGSGTLRITGSAVRNISSKIGMGHAASQALSVNNIGYPVDVSLLTPTDGDVAFNTNGALGCGTGPVVYQTTAAKWKGLYTGVTN